MILLRQNLWKLIVMQFCLLFLAQLAFSFDSLEQDLIDRHTQNYLDVAKSPAAVDLKITENPCSLVNSQATNKFPTNDILGGGSYGIVFKCHHEELVSRCTR